MPFPGPPFDPDLDPGNLLKEQLEGIAKRDFTPEGIVKTRGDLQILANAQLIEKDSDISSEEVTIPGPGGDVILLILRSKTTTKENAPGIYHIHGGAMVLGNRYFLINTVFPFIKELGAVLVSVEYRLAPEDPAPAAIEDCYAGLQWMFENSNKLGIDANKIIAYGASAGGGLAAGVTLLRRDRKDPPLLAQVLVYPMLDDRNTSVSVKQFEERGTFTGKSNIASWDHYLPGIRGSDKVRIYEAPSRAEDLSDLPQTFIEVGASEPFRDEDVAYATKLWEHGIQTELHVWPGGWHAYDAHSPNSYLGQLSMETRMKWMKRILAAPATSATAAK